MRGVTLLLTGDVMTARGIDQLLPCPGDPTLHERCVQDARVYIELAEAVSGPLPRPVSYDYVWGDALDVIARVAPDVRIVNLETSITRSDAYWPGKEVHYRMSPDNVGCLLAARIDVCTLANNHVLDWGDPGLAETLATLDRVGIRHAGAGANLAEATAPAVVELGDRGRMLLVSMGSPSSGIPRSWAANPNAPGVRLVESFSGDEVAGLRNQLERIRRPGDVVVVSVHWGPNWGFDVPEAEQYFARALIREAGVHLVHGHSPHHVRGLEVYEGHAILYGAGDFIDDYEGISGHDEYRGDLGFMYFATLHPRTGRLEGLRLVPTRISRMRVTRAQGEHADWLRTTLQRESARFGTALRATPGGDLEW